MRTIEEWKSASDKMRQETISTLKAVSKSLGTQYEEALAHAEKVIGESDPHCTACALGIIAVLAKAETSVTTSVWAFKEGSITLSNLTECAQKISSAIREAIDSDDWKATEEPTGLFGNDTFRGHA